MDTLVAPKAQEGQRATLADVALAEAARLAMELQSCCFFIRLAVSLIHRPARASAVDVYVYILCEV